MKKKIVIILVLIAFLTFLTILSMIYKNNQSLKGDSNNKQIAYYYEDNNENYVKADEDIWKSGEYILNIYNSSCDGQKSTDFLTWNSSNNSVVLTRNKVTKCSLYFTKKIRNFEFKGTIQEYVVPITGTYKLEVWGAQGGVSAGYGQEGKGGYSTGTVYLTVGEKLYVVVGGQGSSTYTEGLYKGGYNGGGDGAVGSEQPQLAYGGGGATHIAKSQGLLSALENKRDDILIVAGGGGGNGVISTYGGASGGAGGGEHGLSGFDSVNNSSVEIFIGFGATQDSPGEHPSTQSNMTTGSFGQGGSANNQIFGGAGGGGGYYGGSQSSRGHAGGGGGSGYIGNSLLQNGQTIIGNEQMPSPTGNTEVGHSGNGYARITFVM